MEDSKEFQGSFSNSRLCQKRFKGVSRKIEVCFNFNWFLRVLERSSILVNILTILVAIQTNAVTILNSIVTIQNPTGPYGTIWDQTGPYGIMQDPVGP